MFGKMFRGRGCMLFTIIAVSLLGIILFTYSVTYSYSLQEKSAIIETRVDSMNQFLSSVDDDMENAIYISGYRALVGLTDYVLTNGTPVSNATAALKELFLNGSIEGYDSFLMQNNTFPNWTVKIQQKGAEVDINISIAVSSVNVSQEDAWSVTFSVDAELNLSDVKSTANWSRQKAISADISIIGFEDPWYALHTSGVVLKRINQTPYDGNFTVGNDTSNLADHIDKTYYIAFNASPSFLMRFEDDFNASVYGIESLVNKTEILDYCTSTTSSVDNICWRQDTTPTVWRVKDINASDFRIDNETNDAGIGRVDRYDLEDVIY